MIRHFSQFDLLLSWFRILAIITRFCELNNIGAISTSRIGPRRIDYPTLGHTLLLEHPYTCGIVRTIRVLPLGQFLETHVGFSCLQMSKIND